MTRSIICVLLLLAVSATAQDLGTHHNEIGMFVTEAPTSVGDAYIYSEDGYGAYYMHLMIYNPVDETTGDPITTIGGYEFSLYWPDGWSFEITWRGGGVEIFDNGPSHVYRSTTLPVTGDFTVLADVTIGSFGGGHSGGIFVVPFEAGQQTIPGHMAITNADNGNAASRAYPISGSYEVPVAGINLIPVATEDMTWGSVKTLFR